MALPQDQEEALKRSIHGTLVQCQIRDSKVDIPKIYPHVEAAALRAKKKTAGKLNQEEAETLIFEHIFQFAANNFLRTPVSGNLKDLTHHIIFGSLKEKIVNSIICSTKKYSIYVPISTLGKNMGHDEYSLSPTASIVFCPREIKNLYQKNKLESLFRGLQNPEHIAFLRIKGEGYLYPSSEVRLYRDLNDRARLIIELLHIQKVIKFSRSRNIL